MIRYWFGLLAVVGGFLGWQWYSAGPGPTAKKVFEKADRTANKAEQAKVAPASVGAQTGQPRRKSEPPSAPLHESVQGGQQPAAEVALLGDPLSLEDGFERLRLSSGAARERLGVALTRAVDRTDTVDGLLELLGPGNAFLHSKVGRQSVREVVARIQKLKLEDRVPQMSAVLERCMQGPICKTDVEAGQVVDEIYGQHKILVERVVFSPANLSKARSHPVRSGETLGGIARHYRKQGINVEGWTLCYVNRIGNPKQLRAGSTIKIPMEPVWAKVEKESFLMAVYLGPTIVRLYWVGHGVDDKTPVTTFTVGAKLADPDWDAPDGKNYPFGHPENVLGFFFVKFEHKSYQGFGAHGTREPETIRTRSSQGCLRMYDADIKEFFRFVPRGSKVTIAATAN